MSDKGFNHKYRNSVSYNKDHCGVLTAVEDFIKELQATLRASSNYRTKNEEDIENMKLMEEIMLQKLIIRKLN